MFLIKKRGSSDPQYLKARTRSNCPESYNEFLDSHVFNLWKCLFRIFPGSHFSNYTKKKSSPLVFLNMNLLFLLDVCANSLVDSSTCKYMSCLWSLIWSNRVWGSWYLIIWLDITVQSFPMDFWTVTFSSWF